MLLYDKWAEERGWPPEVVRRLRRKELFWLPVIKAGRQQAAEQVAAFEAARNKD